jgi:CPA2 family monovalent cation:H+ antiporter-2
MLLVTVVGLCFGVSLLALKLGYSVALGAFLIGAIIAEARQIAKIEALVQPVRDLFSAVFFVSIGLLIDPAMLLRHAGPIFAITAVVIVGKVLACALGTFLAGNDQRTSLRVGMGLAQIGEFSFIIAGLGLALKATSDFLYPIAVAVSALTTLATPYLIRWSDPLSAWLDRVLPRSVDATLEAYTQWVGQLAASREGSVVGGFVRKWLWQIALNLLLVAGVFIAAAALRGRVAAALAAVLGGEDWVKAALWLAALLLSLPMLIAVFRKLQATAMLLAEVSVRREVARARTDALRAAIATIITAAGSVGLGLFLLLLSSAILPSAKLGLVVLLVAAASAVLLRRAFIRLHARAQGALLETLEQGPAPASEGAPALPALLREAVLETVEITPGSPAAGRLIRELGLRTATGASIVGLERATESLVNPGADEEIKAGDRLLLLGTAAQLAAARAALE